MFLLAPYYAIRGWRRGDTFRTLRERLGSLPPEITARASAAVAPGAVWIHAVSVGEVVAARPLVGALKKRFSGHAVFISTTTETGRRLAHERLPCADGIFYFPLDWVVSVRRALRSIRPALVIVMETEIWPNFLREARRRGIPVVFGNARISERSFARYKRWKFLLGEFFVRVLQDAELFLAQTSEDAARLREMGAPEDRIEVTGNLKFDCEPPALGRFGSVVAEEEESVLAAYDIVQRQWRRALLILAPRKPDRFDAAAHTVAAQGWTAIRRSLLDLAAELDENAEVLVLDSIGELAGIYSVADAVFVGGSIVPAGGHNILEPAWFSKAPVFGSSMENFRQMATQFLAARAGVQVTNGQQLGKVWVQLIEDDGLRERMGKAARELSEKNRGATARSLDRIAAVLNAQGPFS